MADEAEESSAAGLIDAELESIGVPQFVDFQAPDFGKEDTDRWFRARGARAEPRPPYRPRRAPAQARSARGRSRAPRARARRAPHRAAQRRRA